MNDRIESKSFAHEEMSSGIVVLAHGRFRLGLAPGLGGSLTHLDWSNEDGQWIPLMRRGGAAEVAGGNASRLASFVMVPFTNRIDGGRIPVTGAEAAHVPINRPTQNVAIHGFAREADLREAIGRGSAMVVERAGRIAGYATAIGFMDHAVGETDEDLQALIAAAPAFTGPGFLLPTRNTALLRWCLARGLRVIQPLTLMSMGSYQDPRGAFLPSIIF